MQLVCWGKNWARQKRPRPKICSKSDQAWKRNIAVYPPLHQKISQLSKEHIFYLRTSMVSNIVTDQWNGHRKQMNQQILNEFHCTEADFDWTTVYFVLFLSLFSTTHHSEVQHFRQPNINQSKLISFWQICVTTSFNTFRKDSQEMRQDSWVS